MNSSSRVIAVVVVAVDVVVVSLYVCSSCCYSLRSLLSASLSLCAVYLLLLLLCLCMCVSGKKGAASSISILCAERSIDDNST